jgi:hypothetical protein
LRVLQPAGLHELVEGKVGPAHQPQSGPPPRLSLRPRERGIRTSRLADSACRHGGLS